MSRTARKSRVGFEGKLKWQVAATASLDSALRTVRGSNIVVDMRGVVLIGTADGATPDAARGVALLVDSGAHVRIEGLRARLQSRCVQTRVCVDRQHGSTHKA